MVVHDQEGVTTPISRTEIAAEAELREKSQITVPKSVVEVAGLAPRDRLLFVVDPENPDVIHLHRIRPSYAGVLAGVYGTAEEVHASVQEEREAWGA